MSLYKVITDAVRDIELHGYDSPERIAKWSALIRKAAEVEMISEDKLAEMLRESLGQKYKSLVESGALLKNHSGIERVTLERIKPKLRAELDRRLIASADLIKLNREEAIEKTLRRFRGWATSVPVGGSDVVDTNKVKTDVRKSMAQLPFAERRVLIDQGHKLIAAINEITAVDGGAIAAEWHSHWRQAGYDYRHNHKDRDLKIYAIRGNWAQQRGLMKAGDAGYYDDITRVGEEPFCRCFVKYIYSIGKLPPDMITEKGRQELDRVRAAMKDMPSAQLKISRSK